MSDFEPNVKYSAKYLTFGNNREFSPPNLRLDVMAQDLAGTTFVSTLYKTPTPQYTVAAVHPVPAFQGKTKHAGSRNYGQKSSAFSTPLQRLST